MARLVRDAGFVHRPGMGQRLLVGDVLVRRATADSSVDRHRLETSGAVIVAESKGIDLGLGASRGANGGEHQGGGECSGEFEHGFSSGFGVWGECAAGAWGVSSVFTEIGGCYVCIMRTPPVHWVVCEMFVALRGTRSDV